MRIVIDMQGAQTTGSRTRGIGRYTLALVDAMLRNGRDHEFILALNGLFPETVQPLRDRYAPLVGPENLRVWTTPAPVYDLDPDNIRRRDAAEAIRETFIATLEPDAILLTSLFEGLGDNAVCSTARTRRMAPTAVILYDLIPYMRRLDYLAHRPVELWYERKLQQLRLADVQLAISGAAKADSEHWLGTPSDGVINIAAAADAIFHPDPASAADFEQVRSRYGITRGTVMYTGGIDLRKNIPALIEAFSKLPSALRKAHQLVIVCSVKPHDIVELRNLARRNGMDEDELVITGFVSEEDLVAFYRNCDLFVFPSWMEGFGLPVLEAMQCGAAVIGSNASAIPEVIGRADALFDPFSVDSITDKMAEVLGNPSFADELRQHGLSHSRTFTWKRSAETALDAIEAAVRRRRLSAPTTRTDARPRMAFVSPLPPEQSGIANYVGELLPELVRHYDIDLVTDQDEVSTAALAATMPIRSYSAFLQGSHRYDRVVYQFGNSAFHTAMFEALPRVPGVVVLHDFFLSGASHYREAAGQGGDFWVDLYRQHGYHAIADRAGSSDIEAVMGRYPTNKVVLGNARGVIVHSTHAAKLAHQWHGAVPASTWRTVPHLRKLPMAIDRAAARARLGLDPAAFLICSFGHPARTKLNLEAIRAFASSAAAKANALFVLAGNLDGDYRRQVLSLVDELGVADRVSSTGWIDDATYADYIAAADLVVQLRGETRGESSGAVLDAMAAGRCLVVNAAGSLAELPPACVTVLPAVVDEADLVRCIDAHWRDPHGRDAQGARARQYIAEHHDPRRIARDYADAIEAFYGAPWPAAATATAAAARLDAIATPADATAFAHALARSFRPVGTQAQLLVDVTDVMTANAGSERDRLVSLLLTPAGPRRIEPVYRDEHGALRYARKFTLGLLPGTQLALPDAPIDVFAGDVLLSNLEADAAAGSDSASLMLAGVPVVAEMDGTAAFAVVS